jgi:hypothetical protein
MPEVEAGAAPAPEAAVIASTPVESTPDDTMAAVYDKHYPTERVTRADDGKFASKNPPAEGAETAEPAPEITQEPVAETVETAKPSIARPQSWAADLDDFWKSLPPERQEFFAKREGESHQKITQLGEKAASAEKWSAIIDRHRQVVGNQPEQEIENLLQTKAALLRDPNGSIKWLAEQLGVDLSQYAKPAQIGEQPAENDQIRSLSQEVAQLKRQLGETHNILSAREQQETQSREQSLATLVSDFSKDKEDHWSDIEPNVLEQIHAIKAVSPNKDPKEVLSEAYQRAIKLNDEVSNRLTKAKRDKEAADKAAAEAKKAAEAKRLASLNAKSTSGSTPKSAKSIEAEMEEVYDRLARG